ncbi:MAG: hypothetical protein QOE04_4243 [Mycobacterium sp.]|nr:hypothetical protein [Mycobacterium sp.]
MSVGISRFGGWPHAGTNVRRRWWSQAVAAAEPYPRKDIDGKIVHDFKLHELRHTAASLAIQVGANIKALQNAINALLTRDCGQNVGTEPVAGPGAVNTA